MTFEPLSLQAAPSLMKAQMERFEIQPIFNSGLPDVARFIQRRRENDAKGSQARLSVQEGVAGIERRLRWLLVENPVAVHGSPLGYCVRDSLGVIRGLNVCYPAAFLSGGQRLLGLGSGSFSVESPARSLGFYLFKKYLGTPGYSFFFATSCNANSSQLWSKLGGQAAPNSETEYILPIRLDGILAAAAAQKVSGRIVPGIVRLCGRAANPLLRFLARWPSGTVIHIERCEDWEKLSELSRRHRPSNLITSDRSVRFLQWRYGVNSPLSPCGVYLFRDKKGNEGWFAMCNLMRGGQDQLRACVLLDAVWPRETMSFQSIFHEIVRLVSPEVDALFFRSQPGVNYRAYSRLSSALSPEGAPGLCEST